MGLLEEQKVLLITQPSFQTCHLILKRAYLGSEVAQWVKALATKLEFYNWNSVWKRRGLTCSKESTGSIIFTDAKEIKG